jgi:predicted transcriptional regulator
VTRTQERYAGIRARLDACRSQAAISRDTGLTAKTVRRFTRAESVDEFSSRP